MKINKIKSHNIFIWLKDILFYQSVNSKSLLKKYISNRKYRDKIEKLLENLTLEYNEIYTKYSEQYEEYHEELLKITKIRKENQDEVLKLIFPNHSYESFPLQDNYKTYKFNKLEGVDNYCLINLYVSNNGKNKLPDLINIEYFIENNGTKVESYNNFIKSEITKLIQENKLEYHEKDFVSTYVFNKNCFNIIPLFRKSNIIIESQISISSEYKTGINDFSIQSNNLVSFDTVLQTIYKYVNENTKYKVYINEYDYTLKLALSRLNSKHYNDEFIQKLIKKKLKGIYDKGIKINPTTIKFPLIMPNPVDRLKLWNERILAKSQNQISVIEYINSKLPLTAKCNNCQYEWQIRCDHLLDRTYCPKCKKIKTKSESI